MCKPFVLVFAAEIFDFEVKYLSYTKNILIFSQQMWFRIYLCIKIKIGLVFFK